MFVKHKTLLLLAGVVWTIAGSQILRIGIQSYAHLVTVVRLLLSAVIFGIFWRFIFWPLVQKHTERIIAYGETRQFFLRFFDRKAFVIMAVMMTLGIGIRMSGWVPTLWIGIFYTGLGCALTGAGFAFFVKYQQVMRKDETIHAGNHGDSI